MHILPRQETKLSIWMIKLAPIAAVLCLLPYYSCSPLAFNYTGVLHIHPLLTWLCLLPVLAWMAVSFFIIHQRHYPHVSTVRELSVMVVLTVILMAVPYGEIENGLTFLHVLLAFAAVINLNRLLFQILPFYKTAFQVCIAGTFAVFLICITAMSVNGLAEIVYAVTVIASLSTALGEKKNTA